MNSKPVVNIDSHCVFLSELRATLRVVAEVGHACKLSTYCNVQVVLLIITACDWISILGSF